MAEALGSERSRLAKSMFAIGIVAIVLLPVGALGTKFGVWGFGFGFQLLFGGAILAAIGLVGGIVALILAVKRERPSDRQPVMLGLFSSLLVLVVMGLQFGVAVSVPPIHNVSTDTFDPPRFVDVDRGSDANPLEYTREIAAAQREGYPDLSTHLTDADVDTSFDRAITVAQDLGWEVFSEARGDYRIEATATTFWFGFKDDVVIRIRQSGSGSIVDLRSVSRVGQSDLGANARRIGQFLESFEAYDS